MRKIIVLISVIILLCIIFLSIGYYSYISTKKTSQQDGNDSIIPQDNNKSEDLRIDIKDSKILWSIEEGAVNPGQLITKNFGEETELFITGKKFYVTMNLSGYTDMEHSSSLNSEQFFAKQKLDSATKAYTAITPSAWSLEGVDTAEKCREYDFPWYENFVKDTTLNSMLNQGCKFSNVEKVNSDDGRLFFFYVMYNCAGASTMVDNRFYYDYREGYCFQFHVTQNVDPGSLKQTDALLDSIKFVS